MLAGSHIDACGFATPQTRKHTGSPATPQHVAQLLVAALQPLLGPRDNVSVGGRGFVNFTLPDHVAPPTAPATGVQAPDADEGSVGVAASGQVDVLP